jgi:RNA polymerase sigma factor (sigma-70 family)
MVTSENTINDWVVAHTDSLYEWAFYKLSDEELTKDIVQETFITAFQKIDSFEGKSNPKTWLFSILNNKIIDHYRKEFRNPVESGLN